MIIEAPETTRVDYYIPKLANAKNNSRSKKKTSDVFVDHVNEYRVIMESKKNIKLFMAEEHDDN